MFVTVLTDAEVRRAHLVTALPMDVQPNVFSWLGSTDWANEVERGECEVQGYQKLALENKSC